MPKISVMTFSPQVRIGMLASGHFITTLPMAVLRFHAERRSIKVLPVDLADEPCPVVIATLKNRTLNPVVERFIAHIRDFTRPMRDERAILFGGFFVLRPRRCILPRTWPRVSPSGEAIVRRPLVEMPQGEIEVSTEQSGIQ